MRRLVTIVIAVASLLFAFLLTPLSTLAQAQQTAFICPSSTDEKIIAVAKFIKDGSDCAEVRNCYEGLTFPQRAQVFEEVAKLNGLADRLKQEGAVSSVSGSSLLSGTNWQQLIEREFFGYTGQPLSSVINAYRDDACDGSAFPDIDYTFIVRFPSAVNDPDRLKSFAGITLVDAMLTYYQVTIGGINGRGNTASTDVSLCIGDSGVANAGGIDSVRQHLKLYLK